jgi:hypothetical protein
MFEKWCSSPFLGDAVTVPELHILFNTVSIILVNTTKKTGNKAVMFNNKYLNNKRK